MSTKKPTKTAKLSPKQTRTKKASSYKSFRLSKRLRHVSNKQLPVSWRLLKAAYIHVRQHYRIFIGILIVYALLSIVFVKGISSGLDIKGLQVTLNDAFASTSGGNWAVGVALFGFLVGNSGPASGVAGAHQTFLLLVVSLALIWFLRNTSNAKVASPNVTVKNAFYKGPAMLVPLILVMLVISLQLLPVAFASFLYGNIIVSGLAVSALEKILWGTLVVGLILLSLYMLTSSIFAIYIITLPDMTPMKALRSARQLVLHRRAEVARKIIFIIVVTMVATALLVVPTIMLLPVAAEWVLFACTITSLGFVHAYMYTLYRELL